jgi:hypothetical protein
MALNYRRQELIESLGIEQAPPVNMMAEYSSNLHCAFEIPARTELVSLFTVNGPGEILPTRTVA